VACVRTVRLVMRILTACPRARRARDDRRPVTTEHGRALRSPAHIRRGAQSPRSPWTTATTLAAEDRHDASQIALAGVPRTRVGDSLQDGGLELVMQRAFELRRGRTDSPGTLWDCPPGCTRANSAPEDRFTIAGLRPPPARTASGTSCCTRPSGGWSRLPNIRQQHAAQQASYAQVCATCTKACMALQLYPVPGKIHIGLTGWPDGGRCDSRHDHCNSSIRT
jgi:hypothetical protein